jgi:hypothetical protein
LVLEAVVIFISANGTWLVVRFESCPDYKKNKIFYKSLVDVKSFSDISGVIREKLKPPFNYVH